MYKLRWNIELLFKKLKQNFQLHFFYSETENGIKTQIWCTLIAQLLLLVLKVKSETKKPSLQWQHWSGST
ncbi:MAG: transposase [Saprospiraceae bacterium]|nr:transposase [Saprospiraceae bacterium]